MADPNFYFKGILFLNLLNYYVDFFEDIKKEPENLAFKAEILVSKQDSILGRVINFFHGKAKPIGCVGYGTLCLLRSFEKNKWIFKDRHVTGIPIFEECKEEYFADLKFILEENVRELGGKFISSKNIDAPFVVLDGRLATAQNDSSMSLLVKNLALLITQDVF